MRQITVRLCTFVACMGLSFTSAGQDSLKDSARRNGGTIKSKITGESPSMSVKQLAQAAELVLRGRLAAVTTRLSDDESTVFRDFTVTPLTIIKQPANLSQARKPGQLPALTLRQLGGRMVVDGLTLVTTTNYEDRETPMEIGQEYILFLSPAQPSRSTTMSTGSGVYELTSPHWGAYPIRNGKVGNFSRWMAKRTDRTTDDPATFAAQIQEFAKPSK